MLGERPRRGRKTFLLGENPLDRAQALGREAGLLGEGVALGR